MDSNSQKSSSKTGKSDKISDAKKPSSASPTTRDKEYAPLHSAMKCKVTVPDPSKDKDTQGKDGKDGSDEDSEATQGSTKNNRL